MGLVLNLVGLLNAGNRYFNNDRSEDYVVLVVGRHFKGKSL